MLLQRRLRLILDLLPCYTQPIRFLLLDTLLLKAAHPAQPPSFHHGFVLLGTREFMINNALRHPHLVPGRAWGSQHCVASEDCICPGQEAHRLRQP
jgi:hypothetical protein